MTDKPDLFTEDEMTPEGIVANGFFSRRQKLRRLRDMKERLASRAARDETLTLDEAETRMAELDIAMAKVKRQPAAGADAIVSGRMPGA